MSKASVSPTARLLQKSRLFSVPKPLPKPKQSNLSRVHGRLSVSATATTPYPTHQAIDTPHSSRVVGEWGLKRHLPARTTNKTDMPVRVTAQDTNDHVTDFQSNGDLTMALAKFKELSIPLLRAESKVPTLYGNKNVSVYEDFEDNTVRNKAGFRWKYDGPFIVTMPAHEVEKYLNSLKDKRGAWLEYLARYLKERNFMSAKEKQMREEGFFGPVELQLPTVQRSKIMKDAEKEVIELQAAESDSSVDVEKQTADIMQAARERAQQFEAAIDASSQLQSVVETLAAQKQRAADLRTFAQELYKTETRKESEDPEHQAKCDKDLQRSQQEAQHIVDAALLEAAKKLAELEENGAVDEAPTVESVDTVIATHQERFAAAEHQRQQDLKAWEETLMQEGTPDHDAVVQYEKRLRDKHKSKSAQLRDSDLTQLLGRFLDLPGLAQTELQQVQRQKVDDTEMDPTRAKAAAMRSAIMAGGFGERAERSITPNSTHPGAGLGYLRSKAYMENHPVHGPQLRRAPVLSRVVRPRSWNMLNEPNAKIGLAGFVGLDPKVSRVTSHNVLSFADDPLGTEKATHYLDPYVEGGNKVWMHSESAVVYEDGKVGLQLMRPDLEAVAVAKGDVSRIVQQKESTFGPSNAFIRSMAPIMGRSDGSTSRYGASLPSTRAPIPPAQQAPQPE